MTNILVNPTQDHIMALLSKLAYVDLSVNYDFSLLTNNTQFCFRLLAHKQPSPE